MVTSEDLPRFADIGVVADFQQSPDAVSTDYHQFLSDSIGNRAFDLIPTARVLDAGATVSLSSDWDAGPLPPLGTIQRSLTREENAVLDLETAIELQTVNAAYALGHDDNTGSIEVGKYADFVVLDQDLFELDVKEIDSTEILATFLAGQPSYESSRWKQF